MPAQPSVTIEHQNVFKEALKYTQVYILADALCPDSQLHGHDNCQELGITQI